MICRTKPLILAAILGLAALGARAQVALSSLTAQADAIVVGQIRSGQQYGNAVSFALTVVRSLKGTLAPGATATVSGSSQMRSHRDLTGLFGMWFLKSQAGGQWTVVQVSRMGPLEQTYFQLSSTASPSTVLAVPAPASLDDQIAIELAAGLRTHTDALQVHHLAGALIAAKDSAVTRSIFQSFRTSSDPELLALALARRVSSTLRHPA